MKNRDIALKIEKTIEWLREQVKKSNTKGLVLGISGGIDSALVGFLIKKAFPNNSMGVILPCNSCSKDREDALKVINTCNIKCIEIDLTDEHKSIMNKVKNELQHRGSNLSEDNLKLSDANLRARLRMCAVYSIANAYNYLVVGTDNAAEMFTGYFTKFGDGGVDISPIANLTKREVKEWSLELGVPKDVVDKVPSAGLWEGQTDEKEIGTTYDMVDDFLEGKEIPQKDVDIILQLHNRTEHKRNIPAICPKF